MIYELSSCDMMCVECKGMNVMKMECRSKEQFTFILIFVEIFKLTIITLHINPIDTDIKLKIAP